VLDPEQNSTFNDHYLEVDYDLSNVMFITTANSLRMAQPLMDRMEIIRLAGYTEDEKVAIARKHLIIKQIEANGLKEGELDLHDDAVRDLVRYYTREAGVRNLEREIANLARKATKEILMKGSSKVKITRKNLDKYAGVRRFRYGEAELEDLVGITTGLAWTEVGGELLQIEAVLVPGRGRMSVTGKLGDVMQESVQAANAYVRSCATLRHQAAGVREARHPHPCARGPTPADGPSAGGDDHLDRPGSDRRRCARKSRPARSACGRVPLIGGLKEKLPRLRGGLKTVLIPKENERDLPEIPDNVKKGLDIVPVSTVDEVLARALGKPLVAIEWPNDLEPAVPAKPAEGAEAIRAH
jgi:ATP-dependent Lon protease